MTPPPAAALALLGGTIFMMVWATATVRTPGSELEYQYHYETSATDARGEQSDRAADDGRSGRSVSDADD
ncbi:hypothetical protein [Natrinema pallidum]|uniref:Uncharacterized protein n=2 Tax=Natrinema pallidum TaxID=69527 RepID=L9YS76_9EURY|nr:hypothetical protein [Natrinema pallidum]ELY76501.1 hypothetical protein C487_11769 [Natrinema pallidum DSM 3751]QCW03129.1 hypothetical protein FGF80_07710 [Natrinema pallidum]